MIEITDSAAEKIIEYLSLTNITSPIRIVPVKGCGGPSLGVTFDEKKETDLSHQKDSLTVLIDPDLSQTLGKVKIDFKEAGAGGGCGGGGGFSVTSTNPFPSTAGGCSGSSSSGCEC